MGRRQCYCPAAKQHEHAGVETRAGQFGGSFSGEAAPWDVFMPHMQVQGAAEASKTLDAFERHQNESSNSSNIRL